MIYKANVNTEGETDSNAATVEDFNIPLMPTAHHPDRKSVRKHRPGLKWYIGPGVLN